MSSIWGNKLKISIFGESHGESIGAVLDGLPAGEDINIKEIDSWLLRRSSKNKTGTTARREADEVKIISGLLNNKTTGSPLALIINNADKKSSDYDSMPMRPSHADYTGFVRYGGHCDMRGGGHFSGRLTAPFVAAGCICAQILAKKKIQISAYIKSIGNAVSKNNKEIEEEMIEVIRAAQSDGDSVGGIVECVINNVPAGIGDPNFDGLENKISSVVFAIPGIKGIEFGDGFKLGAMLGSEANDAMRANNGKIEFLTNHNGGILGGISNGSPIVFRVAVKPTPSIAKPQQSVDIKKMQNVDLVINGRHDACIVERVVPCVQAAAAIAALEAMI